jgi:dolichol kinase
MTPAVIYCNVSSMEDANRGQEVTIVARKWFHLVAVALFVPVTLFAPKLQSLSYAIALAALMVLEAIRSHVPSVNAFYARYVDRDKQEREDSVLVSHMALVVGCAAPLWIAEYCSSNDETLNSTVRTVLSLWGVLCLGIGDAAGAVVGVYFGRHYWSALNRRTIEGSLAMLASMSLPCWLFVDDWKVWVPAVLFTTLLEAWTIQLDNLVLPLVGSTIILLCQPSRV